VLKKVFTVVAAVIIIAMVVLTFAPSVVGQ
jgi:hypothetical protein